MNEIYEYVIEDCGCGTKGAPNRDVANVWRVKRITKRNGRTIETQYMTDKINKALALQKLAGYKQGNV